MYTRPKLYLLGALLLALFTVKSGWTQTFQWATGSEGTSLLQTADIATDDLGNSYIVGEFNGTLIFGTDTIISATHYANGPELFVAKFDPDGVPLWINKASGPGLYDQCQGESIDIDAAGNAYVTGYYRNQTGFGLDSMTSVGANSNVFVAKINASGIWQWASSAGMDNMAAGTDIAVAPNGMLYVGGYFSDSTYFYGDFLSSDGLVDLFLAQYDNLGNYQWVRKIGGGGFDIYGDICTDANNNIYITGAYDSTTTIGANVLTTTGLKDVFVAKYDGSGNVLWANGYGSSSEDQGFGIEADNLGSIYITGRFRTFITFGATSLSSSGGDDFFLVKMHDNGVVDWARRGGGPDFATTTGVSISANYEPVICGYYNYTMNVGGNIISNANANGSTDAFVAKYDTIGVAIWAHSGGSLSSDDAEAISCDALGNAYITGRYTADAMFDDQEITLTGSSKIFVAELNDWLLTTNVSGLVQCSNPAIQVDYTVNGSFNAGNVFTAELSDANGYFDNPVNIGSVSSTTSGSITCNLPYGFSKNPRESIK